MEFSSNVSFTTKGKTLSSLAIALTRALMINAFVKEITSDERVFPFRRLGENLKSRFRKGTAIKRIKL